MTSELAKRLACDLVQVGKRFGFKATKEKPVLDGSSYCIDVFWELPMPKKCPFPTINVASIEIQHSNSSASISHNIFKAESTRHPALHIVISYNELTEDYKRNILDTTYPKAGLFVIDGEDRVRGLNLWITRFLTMKQDEQVLSETGRNITNFVKNYVQTDVATVSQAINTEFGNDIKKVFLPPELSEFLDSTINFGNVGAGRKKIDDVYDAFIRYVQQKLEATKVKYIEVLSPLFPPYYIEEDFQFDGITLCDTIEIRTDKVYLRDNAGKSFDVQVRDGNVLVKSIAGTVCVQPLRVNDLYHFISKASKEVEHELRAYEITNTDKEKLSAIIDAL